LKDHGIEVNGPVP